MAKIDQNTINGLYKLNERLNSLLDHVIIYRQTTVYKADYRFISNRVQKALTEINDTLVRINQNNS